MTENRTRRKRDPERTREAILEAAREVLAQDGKEGVSVVQVAHRAGVNRGTAYQHFQTREQLIEATAAWVSDKLYHAVFGDPALDRDQRDQEVDATDVEAVNENLATFAMENPELGRIWLFEVLSSKLPANDPFWRHYESTFKKFAKTALAQPGIDVEVLSVLLISGAFIWPVWVRSHARTAKERQQMMKRYTREILRLTLHGTLRPEKYRDLDALINKPARASEPAPGKGAVASKPAPSRAAPASKPAASKSAASKSAASKSAASKAAAADKPAASKPARVSKPRANKAPPVRS